MKRHPADLLIAFGLGGVVFLGFQRLLEALLS